MPSYGELLTTLVAGMVATVAIEVAFFLMPGFLAAYPDVARDTVPLVILVVTGALVMAFNLFLWTTIIAQEVAAAVANRRDVRAASDELKAS